MGLEKREKIEMTYWNNKTWLDWYKIALSNPCVISLLTFSLMCPLFVSAQVSVPQKSFNTQWTLAWFSKACYISATALTDHETTCYTGGIT